MEEDGAQWLVGGGDVSKSEVEFSPREKIEESSELWYGSRPDRLDVPLVRHKQERSSMRRFLTPGSALAQLRPATLRDTALIKAIENKWPQFAKDVLRSYAAIGVPIDFDAVSNRVVETRRLLRLTFAAVARVVSRGRGEGYRYEYLYSYQYLPSEASQSLPRGAAVHMIQPASKAMVSALRASDISGRLANGTEIPVVPDRLPSVLDKRSPRAVLTRLDIVDTKKNVVATVPVALWEPKP